MESLTAVLDDSHATSSTMKSHCEGYSSIISCSRAFLTGWISVDSARDEAVPTVTAYTSIRDLDENKSRNFLESYALSENKGVKRLVPVANSLTSGMEIVKPLLMSLSPSQSRKVILRIADKKTVIEIVDELNPHRIDASPFHGEVIGDSWFGGSSWSHDEKYFIYVAKVKETATSQLFGGGGQSNPEDGSISKYEFLDCWGEKYESTGSLCLCVIQIETGAIQLVPGIDLEKLTVGQPIFAQGNSEDGSKSVYNIVYTGWENKPRRFGVIYCYQRLSALYAVDIASMFMPGAGPIEHHCLTGASLSIARSPRYSLDHDALVFLGRSHRRSMQTHNGCVQLFAIRKFSESWEKSADPDNSLIACLVDIVDVPSEDFCGGFPGIYCDQLPKHCFYSGQGEGLTIIFNSQWGGRDVILQTSIQGSSHLLRNISDSFNFSEALVEDHHLEEGHTDSINSNWNNIKDGSFVVLDISHEFLLFQCSAPNQPQRIALCQSLSKIFKGPSPSQFSVSSYKSNKYKCSSISRDLIWRIFQQTDEAVSYEFTMILPRPSTVDSKVYSPVPLIVIPHGGPHSCLTSAFIGSSPFLALELQAAVVYVNYRGSTGFGESSILSLPGNIGTNDVQDVMACVQRVLGLSLRDILSHQSGPSSKSDPFLDVPLCDIQRVSVVGGSHGGFLGLHLIGQHPDTFRAACVRNPVSNIPAMACVSDIPDWCWVEVGIPYNFQTVQPPSADVLGKMLQCSPIRYIDSVKTPLLICIGSKDRRVPPSQGIEYYHMLKARGVKCKLMEYPDDCHAIDRPTTEAEQWLAISLWLKSLFQ